MTLRKLHSAVKHAGFSPTTLLPGENPAAFEKLHEQLSAELAPTGPLEQDIVGSMARLVWRRQNLATFRIADLARKRLSEIKREDLPGVLGADVAQFKAIDESACAQARKELGEMYALIEIGETATLDRLMQDLTVEDRLDAMIDKCMKRLLFVRGLKSISSTGSSVPSLRIAGPPEAA